MEQQTYNIEDEKLGKEIVVIVNRRAIISDIQHLVECHKAGPDSEYPQVGRVDINGTEVTQEWRDKDLLEIQDFITKLTDEDKFDAFLKEAIAQQPRKKNGSFAKGRVNNIAMFDSFGSYWEDSYGTNTPAIRTRAKDDYTMEIVYEEFVVKY